MNIFRPQVPYVFSPPKYSPVWAPILRWIAVHFYLRKKFKVFEYETEGVEKVAELNRRGDSILIAPNHADHADPGLLANAGKSVGVNFHFMAAREGFEASAVNRFALQRIGAFSVDREGADLAAVKTAMKIIEEGRFPLVIFPEGEIYHHHEVLDELNEGVATILLRTLKRLKEGRNCYLVPTGMRYQHKADVEQTFTERLNRLEERITWKPMPHLAHVERIYRLGSGLLAIKEEEWLGQSRTGAIVERIQFLQNRLVEIVEEKHGAMKDAKRLPQRVKWLRNKIRKILTDVENPLPKDEEWFLYHDLDTLFMAVQLYSYPGQYLKEQPSVTRIAETLLKLEEDVLGEGMYEGERIGQLKFGEPIDVKAYLAEHGLDAKTGVGPVTHELAKKIQTLISSFE